MFFNVNFSLYFIMIIIPIAFVKITFRLLRKGIPYFFQKDISIDSVIPDLISLLRQVVSRGHPVFFWIPM